MTPDEARKLLGGYATGTLTSEEQQALFAAALEDQALFDELAREQAFKDAFDDPAARAELLDVVSERRRPAWMRWWGVPAGAGALALAGLTVVLLMHKEPRLDIAQVQAPTPVAESVAPAAPKPEAPANAPAKSVPMRRQIMVASVPEARDQAEDKRVADAGRVVGAITAVPQEAPPPPALEKDRVEVAAGRAEVAAAPAAAMRMKDAAAPSPAEQLFESGTRTDAPGASMAFATGGALARKKAEAPGPPYPGPGLKYSISADGITAEPNLNGFLQVYRRDASGDWIDVGPGAMPVKARTPIAVKVAAGAERVIVLLPRALVLRSTDVDSMRDLAAQAVTGRNGNFHFAVNPNPAPDAVLVVIVGAGQR